MPKTKEPASKAFVTPPISSPDHQEFGFEVLAIPLLQAGYYDDYDYSETNQKENEKEKKQFSVRNKKQQHLILKILRSELTSRKRRRGGGRCDLRREVAILFIIALTPSKGVWSSRASEGVPFVRNIIIATTTTTTAAAASSA